MYTAIVRAYNKLYNQHAEPLAFWQEIDAGFDGGEFCAEAHTRDWEDMECRVESAICSAYGIGRNTLRSIVYEYRRHHEECFMHEGM